MKKILFIAGLLYAGLVSAQVPVSQPQYFLKWIRIHDSVRAAIYFQGINDTLATQAYARGFAGGNAIAAGYAIRISGDTVILDTAHYRKMDSMYVVTDSTFIIKINGVATAFKMRGSVFSFNGRTAAVLPQATDYAAFYPQLSGSYSDPPWITSLSFSKLIGLPNTLAGHNINNGVINANGGYSWGSGVFSARPAFGNPGAFYYALDTIAIYYDNGSSWAKITTATGGIGADSAVLAGLGLLKNVSGTNITLKLDTTYIKAFIGSLSGISQIFSTRGITIGGTDTVKLDTTVAIAYSDTLAANGIVTKTFMANKAYLTTESDPVANAKTITHTQGSGILITGSAGQTLGSNPSWTFKADTSLLATKNYVNTQGFLSSETDPVANAKTITETQGSGILITGTAGQTLGSGPAWTFKSDTALLATHNYVNTRGFVASESDPIAIAKTITVNQASGILVTGLSGQTLGVNPSWTLKADTSLLGTHTYINSLGFIHASDTAAMLSVYLRIIGAINARGRSANGLTIGADTLYGQTADGTHPGFESAAEFLELDSIYTGKIKSKITLGHPGPSPATGLTTWSGYSSVAGDSLYLKNITAGLGLSIVTSGTDSGITISPNLAILADLTSAQTLTNKTLSGALLFNPEFNTSSSIGQYWIATDNIGHGSWQTATLGITGIGTYSTASILNGATVSGNNLILAAADSLNAGLLTPLTQFIKGSKTFVSSTAFTNSVKMTGLSPGSVNDSAVTIDGSGNVHKKASVFLDLTGASAGQVPVYNASTGGFVMGTNGAGNPNTFVGSSFRPGFPGTNIIKTFTGGIGEVIDSNTTNVLNWKADTSYLVTIGSTQVLTGNKKFTGTLNMSGTVYAAPTATTKILTKDSLSGDIHSIGYQIVDTTGAADGAFVKWNAGRGLFVLNSSAGVGTVTKDSVGNLAPLFTASTSNPTTTPVTTFTLSSVAPHNFFGNFGTVSAPPGFGAPLLASADFAGQGTQHILLHGNTGGTPVWGAVDMASEMTGTMQAAQAPAFTGDVTNSAGSLALAIGAGKVTNTMLAGSITASKLVGTDISIAESQLTFTDITTNNVSTTKHGFIAKLPNVSGQYWEGVGGYSAITKLGTVVSGDISAILSSTLSNTTYGTYTPTITAKTNVNGGASSGLPCKWMRIGNNVIVFGQVSITATSSNTATIFGLSLPVSSTFTATTDGSGHGSTGETTSSTDSPLVIASNTSTNTMDGAYYTRLSGVTMPIFFSFSYTVQ